jgi:2-dehydro-3-deoxygalactonokinase
LRKSGTLSQLMAGETLDATAFHKGVAHAMSPGSGHLLHSLFSVRTLGLFERLPPASLPGYMSGLLIGAELSDAAAWLKGRGAGSKVTGIGAPALLKAYRDAAAICGLELVELDSAELLPRALFSIAETAGLLRKS